MVGILVREAGGAPGCHHGKGAAVRGLPEPGAGGVIYACPTPPFVTIAVGRMHLVAVLGPPGR